MEKNSNIVIGIVALIVGIGIGYLASGGSFRDSGGYMMPGGFTASQNIDRHFIEEMIPHHEGAIEMAKLALLRSKRPEMLSLSNGIIEAQEREINNMKGWYEAWFGTAVPAYSSGMMGGMGHGVGMQMGSMEGDLDALAAASAADFDRVFIRQMIPHHEMAVMMARMLTAGTARDEMKQLAGDIITSQSQEIEMMRGWLLAWYGLEN